MSIHNKVSAWKRVRPPNLKDGDTMFVCLLQASDHLRFLFAIATFTLEASIVRERKGGRGTRKSKRGRETKSQ